MVQYDLPGIELSSACGLRSLNFFVPVRSNAEDLV